MEFLIPTCNCVFVEQDEETDSNQIHHQQSYFRQTPSKRNTKKTIIVTGTMYGYRGGKMYFCIQTVLNSSPRFLLELVVPNKTLAREMQGGVLHIELKNETLLGSQNVVIWTMYCNMKKAGFAVRRRVTTEDLDMIGSMKSVEIGAGTFNKGRKELMYLRARFERTSRPFGAESFHLIDPEGCNNGQELSITFHG